MSRRGEESGELARLALEEVRGAVGGIGSLHHAIADRAFRVSGPGAAPVRVVHGAISDAVYGTIRGGYRLSGRAAKAALARREGGSVDRALSATPQGALAIAILNGLVGDTLEREESELHQPMAVRVGGEPVERSPDAVAAAFPSAGPRVAVFLHGLMETEFSWGIGGGEPYGARLERELGITPVYVRYNCGRHISDNGRSFSCLLDELLEAWPVDVEELVLVGHSMGGLVARSACHTAVTEGGSGWVSRVRHTVGLGTPHFGAPLEQGVHWASAALAALPETRPLSNFLRRRSAGIRDLRRGSLVDEDWRDRDPDALRAAACAEVPLLDGATHCFVSATITRDARHPVGRLLGDILVLVPSATGSSRARRIGFDEEYGHHVGGVHHFALLNHPAVYERLREWLAASPAAVS